MYIDAYLQPCPGYGWQGGPEFSTEIVTMMSGRERRNGRMDQPLHRYAAPFNNISREAYTQVKRMHMACRGQLHVFRFRDELDHSAVNQVFATGNGTQTVFQLATSFVIAGIPVIRNVYAIVDPALVTINSAPASGYTIDYRRGTVTFNTPPAAGAVLRWTGTFDVWVRFNQDYLPFTLDHPDGTNGSVDLYEQPPPGVNE